jgi:hypothetical protein
MKVIGSDNKSGKKIIMKGIILQPILISCFEGITISHLISTVSSIMPVQDYLVKKYLFYMIECNLISYSGRLKLFLITKEGINLLLQIELMKSIENLSTEQIFLQINE